MENQIHHTGEKTIGFAEENADVKQQNALLKKVLYGQKSEKAETVLENVDQLNLFDKAETEATVSVEHPEPVALAAHSRKSKRTHAEILKELPTEEVVHPVEDRNCPECCSEMVTVGKEFVREEVVYIPARMLLRKQPDIRMRSLSIAPTRNGDYAVRFLSGYSGHLVCDGYDGDGNRYGFSR